LTEHRFSTILRTAQPPSRRETPAKKNIGIGTQHGNQTARKYQLAQYHHEKKNYLISFFSSPPRKRQKPPHIIFIFIEKNMFRTSIPARIMYTTDKCVNINVNMYILLQNI